MYTSIRMLVYAASISTSLAAVSPTTYVSNAARHVSASTVTPPPHPRFDRSLRKRAEWVSVCADGATDCPIIGVSDIVQEPDGDHYIPMCDSISCQWIGYAEPSSKGEGSTSYVLSTTADTHIVIPVILPPGGEPLIVPPGGEGDGPDGIDEFPTITTPSKTCSDISTTITVTEPLTFAMDSWNSKTGSIDQHTLAWLEYFDVVCPAGQGLFTNPSVVPTPTSTAVIVDPMPTAKPAPYAEGICRINVQLDQWSGDRDDISPFWIHITGMTDNAGNNLRGTEDDAGWSRCGATYPCYIDTLLEDRFVMRPILAPDSSVPYIHFEAGAQNWRSDQVGDVGKGPVPACTMVPCLLCDNP